MELSNWEFDVFISYAHRDNEPLIEGQPGWITQFHDIFAKRLGVVLGKTPRIWRDENMLRGNVLFDDEIKEKVQKSAALVCILSPSYIASNYCVKELKWFIEAARGSGNIKIGNSTRMFKVLKAHIERGEHPPEIHGMLGYEFYMEESEEGVYTELMLDTQEPEILSAYLKVLNKLVYHFKRFIKDLETHDPNKPPNLDPSQKTIYLAETTYDLRSERDQIRSELEQSNHLVLPDMNLPIYEPNIEKVIESYLERSDLSIHMIGANYGVVPENASVSLNELQLNLAARKANEDGLFPMIWIPSDLDKDQIPKSQQRFIEKLQSDEVILTRAELLQTNLTELKSFIDGKLSAPRQEEVPKDEVVPNQVFLICDQEDLDEIKVLDEYLFSEGFDVKRSPFEGDQKEIRKAHQYYMKVCESVLIYHGKANALWLDQKLHFLRKIKGYGREKPLLAKAIYLAPPKTAEKEQFRTHLDIQIIRENGGFSPALLQPFVEKLKRAI